MMYDSLLSTHHQKQPSQISLASSMTGLRSAPSVAKTEDEEPPSWGDMDPELVKELKNDPAKLQVFMATRRPRKEARLDPNLGQFSMSTDVPPPPEASGSVQAPDITKESMKEAFEEYHSTFVTPAIAQLHDHVVGTLTPQIKSLETKNTLLRTSLASVEAEMHKRAVLIHQVPPFCTKKVIDDNLYYLLNMAQLDRTDVQSVSNHLLTSSTSFIRIVFLAEAMAKQFFTSFRHEALL